MERKEAEREENISLQKVSFVPKSDISLIRGKKNIGNEAHKVKKKIVQSFKRIKEERKDWKKYRLMKLRIQTFM